MLWFYNLEPVLQGLLATIFTYGVTALGASVVFLFNNIDKRFLDVMMGSSGGVMIAASYWSLLSPAIDMELESGNNPAISTAVGFLLGGAFIMASDIFLEKHQKKGNERAGWKKCVLLTTAVTMHNIPEGLAVGVAFGGAAINGGRESIVAAMMLALGIGIQNFPEGTCVAMPLRREGVGRFKSFIIGQFSGMVEPVAGVLGALFAIKVRCGLPLALSFSAGAMICVVCSELVPDSFRDNKYLATMGLMAGFVIMMVLDVMLG